jgi:acyl dehydratase
VALNELTHAPRAVVHEGLPRPSLLGAVLRPRRGLREGDRLPDVRVEARGVSASAPTRDAVAYARICGFAMDGRASVPPTWPQVLAAPLHLSLLGDPAFPLPVLGIVHVAQRIRVLRPILGSEVLDLHARVSEHRAVRAGVEFDLHTDAYAGDERVWQGVTTILSRVARERRPRGSPSDGRDGGPRQARERPVFDARRSTVLRVPADIGRRYGAIAGDRNPIHLHAWTARLFGFPRAIAHGMWTLARAIAELDTDVPQRCEIEARFVKPVFLPSRVLIEAGPVRPALGSQTLPEAHAGLPNHGQPMQPGVGFGVYTDKGDPCVVGTVHALA